MNVQAFLEDAASMGEADSQGAFTTNLEMMLERLGGNLLVDPTLAPLVAVAGAVACKARSLDILGGKKELRFRLALDSANGSDDIPQPLLLATSVWRRSAARVCLELPSLGRRLMLTPQSHSLESRSVVAGAPVELVVSGKVPPPGAIELLLLRHCGLCPTPLSLAGRSLAGSLERAHPNALWSKSVPEHLRPKGQPVLATPLPLLLAPSARPRAAWVAVVGGISYPFLLPEVPGVQGIVWSQRLRTDLGMTKLALDRAWSGLRQELIHQSVTAGLLGDSDSSRMIPS